MKYRVLLSLGLFALAWAATAQTLSSPSYNSVTSKKALVGSASTWWNKYLPGSADNIVSVVTNPTAKWGSFLTATRSSENVGSQDNIISDTCLGVADNTKVPHRVWCRYSEGVIPSDGLYASYLGEENSVKNLSADAPALDPFSTIRGVNPPRMIVNLRLNNGIGDGTVSRKISAFLNLSNNSKATAGYGGYAKAGIVVAADALDLSNGAGTALALGPNHAIDWYNSPSSLGWRIRRSGDVGTGQIILGNNRFDLQLGEGKSQLFRATTNGVGINVDPAYTFDVVGTARYSYTTIAGGSAPAISGMCAATFVAGGNVAGKLNLTSSCTATSITLSFTQATPNGYFCDATNENNVSAIVKQTADTTTSVTLTTTGAANDKILYKCVGF
ncbi:hypothetical protein [Rhizobium rhizogenes]|uniref:hypothetical protein n=1 Tax=Rhizobium rhizogenes TaxID=359 RepID=UPI001573A0F9|nr:hypothetical protein [Rhizobium rhizogenes]NTF42801.1 hypothetical protein [Rhizobium rhizogenes]